MSEKEIVECPKDIAKKVRGWSDMRVAIDDTLKIALEFHSVESKKLGIEESNFWNEAAKKVPELGIDVGSREVRRPWGITYNRVKNKVYFEREKS